ncbi:hypothetical protein N7520_005543 [Penicillium odoratum]|uniref:uncharacterized protein n=1 Tax=Penicillium odoratum TaxID=1167516 RepID=UPI002547F77D|nr:uncharacterized protein N7520_005543 [Penicillium odoratum]KAJ5758387.1 hypothetical protein N7520_005543 [Penicillium odoratum]
MTTHTALHLPPFTPTEFKHFNRMADTMQALVRTGSNFMSYHFTDWNIPQHQWFRVRWNVIYDVAQSGRRSGGMSIKKYLNLCLEFCRKLETHHQIEEVRVFPYLARRMPAFANNDILVAQHKVIHSGLENWSRIPGAVYRVERTFAGMK